MTPLSAQKANITSPAKVIEPAAIRTQVSRRRLVQDDPVHSPVRVTKGRQNWYYPLSERLGHWTTSSFGVLVRGVGVERYVYSGSGFDLLSVWT